MWEGAYNARDLGGLRTADGREIRWGALVRSASPAFLTEAGWAQLWEHGVRTVIDLTTEGELGPDLAPRPAELRTVRLPLDPTDDVEFWSHWGKGLHGTPLYHRPFLDRFPQLTARVAAAVAHAEPGGVLVHCSAGRDRTGIITLVLLRLAGVAVDDIVAEHLMSHESLRPMFARLGKPDQQPIIEAVLAEHGTTPEEALRRTLAGFDAESHLRSGGLTDDDVTALHDRLVAPAPAA